MNKIAKFNTTQSKLNIAKIENNIAKVKSNLAYNMAKNNKQSNDKMNEINDKFDGFQ